MDGYSSNMRDHMANCCAAHGLSSAGSEQLANYQMPTNPPDQAMMKAIGRSQTLRKCKRSRAGDAF